MSISHDLVLVVTAAEHHARSPGRTRENTLRIIIPSNLEAINLLSRPSSGRNLFELKGSVLAYMYMSTCCRTQDYELINSTLR